MIESDYFRALVLGDLHSGSQSAPMDSMMVRDHINQRDVPLIPTDLQSYMTRALLDLVRDNEYDVCIVNGDVCAGDNEGVGGMYLSTVDLSQQVDIAVNLLRNIKTPKFRFTVGTPYHSMNNRPLEHVVAERLEKRLYEMDPIHSDIQCSFEFDYTFDIFENKVHVGHCIDWKGDIIETLKREIGCNGSNLAIRNHRHEYGYVEKERGGRISAAVAGPCWEFRTQFGLTNGMYGMPCIGLMEVEFWRDKGFKVTPKFVDMRKFMTSERLA